ncbi:MAG: hypothetical protein RLZZ04_4773 [Cyanobacteriota bacterium]|jgi:hypothetical protein
MVSILDCSERLSQLCCYGVRGSILRFIEYILKEVGLLISPANQSSKKSVFYKLVAYE